MKNYELTIVLPEKATAAKKKTVNKTIEKLIDTLKGKITEKDDWGKIDFAYEIKGETSGNFMHYKLELNAEAAKAVSEKLKLEEDLIRQLLVAEE